MLQHSNTSRKIKKPSVNKHLLLIASFLFVFAAGLVVGRVQSGAVLPLLLLVSVVIMLLLGECFYLWQLSIKKPLRKKSLPKKAVMK